MTEKIVVHSVPSILIKTSIRNNNSLEANLVNLTSAII